MVPRPDMVVVVAGLALALTALACGWRQRFNLFVALAEATADPDPSVRRRAVLVAGQRSVRDFAPVLLDRALQETDASVRNALLEVVLRRSWEPSDSAELVELRMWAESEAELRVTAGHPTGTAVVAGGQVKVAEARRPAAGRDTGRGGEKAPAEVEDRPTVIVTGAGGPVGVAVIRALVAAGHRVVGADSDALAVGARLAHGAATIPPADAAGYVAELCRLGASSGAAAVVPTVAEELVALSLGGAELAAAGVASWVPDPAAVVACNDKWRFAQVLLGARLPGPATALGTHHGVPGPWVVKPRSGRGSRDIWMADTPEEVDAALSRVPDAIVQTRLQGQEFTVDALVDRDGVLAGAVPRWRLETKAGICTKGRTFADTDLVDLVGQVLTAVGLRGPANVQGFVGPDGRPSLVEVNPRFSGGLPLSLAAGADLVGEYVRAIVGRPVRPERLQFRPGVTMLRHFDEVFE